MKWYKRDPDAALAGMAELSFEECGAYNRLLDLLYSRDGDVPDNDAFCAKVFHCRPQVWRRLKALLVAKGKVRIKTDGKLTANRVETELQTASKHIEIMRSLRQKQLEKQHRSPAVAPGQPHPHPHPDKKVSKRERKALLPLPDNWHPMEALSADDQIELDKMKDWARGNAIRKADWFATWRNWRRRAAEFKEARYAKTARDFTPVRGSREDRQRRTAAAFDKLDEYIRQADADGSGNSGQTGAPVAGWLSKFERT